jgi:hypothetical protein
VAHVAMETLGCPSGDPIFWWARSPSPVFSALIDIIYYMRIFRKSMRGCNFTDINRACMPIWPTATQQPGQRKCQQKLLELTYNLACWSLVNKLLWNAVVIILLWCSVSWQFYI